MTSISILVNVLNQQSFDSGRNSVLQALLPTLEMIPMTILPAILNTYSYDSGRVTAISTLVRADKLVVDYQLIPSVLNCMTYDSGRNEALGYLVMNQRVPADSYPSILRSYSYDSGRQAALHILGRADLPLADLRSCFTYVKNFLTVARSWSVDEALLTPFVAEKSSNRFSVMHVDGGSISIDGTNISFDNSGSVTVTKNPDGSINITSNN